MLCQLLNKVLTPLRAPCEPTKLEYLRQMDLISIQLEEVKRKIHMCIKKKLHNEKIYWIEMWEKLEMLHMEFEWGLHPMNEERIY